MKRLTYLLLLLILPCMTVLGQDQISRKKPSRQQAAPVQRKTPQKRQPRIPTIVAPQDSVAVPAEACSGTYETDSLSLEYYFGEAVANYQDGDYQQALRYLNQVLSSGDAYSPAWTLLGKMALNGEGMNPDPSYAFQCFQAAASGDDPEGTYMMGYMFECGLNGPKNLQAAVQFYCQAAEMDYEPALLALRRLQ